MKQTIIFILILMFSVIPSKLIAQEIIITEPEVILNEDYIECNNFPGISKDGKYIINVHSDYSCCISTEFILELREIKTGKIIRDILIHPSEADDAYLSEEDLKSKINTINILLEKYKFESMAEVQLFTSKEEGNNLTFIEFENKQKIFKSQLFKLSKYSVSYYCCGYIKDSIPCYLNTNVHKVWRDQEMKVIFISHGIIRQTDGCDVGPFYKILGIIED